MRADGLEQVIYWGVFWSPLVVTLPEIMSREDGTVDLSVGTVPVGGVRNVYR